MLDPANIIRSKRRTLSLYIDDKGVLIVRAPVKLSNAKIFQFVKDKQDWIVKQQQRVAANRYLDLDVLNYNSFLFLGQSLRPYVTDSVKKVVRQDCHLLVPAKVVQAGEGAALKKVEKWLRNAAKAIIEERCEFFAHRLQLQHGKFLTNNNKTRWGSCDLNGNIALNWRCVMLPPHLVDYVVVHEFCHLLEFNHTREFWQLVEAVLPNWRRLRVELKQFGWVLGLFRVARK